MPIRIMLLCDSQSEIKKLEQMIVASDLEIIHSSVKLSSASEEVVEFQPDMVVLSCSNKSWSFRACQQIYMLHPNVITVMVSEDESYEIAKKSIEAGANSYIAPIPDASSFSKELSKIYNNEKNRQVMLLQNSEISRKANVITMFSPKGGVGKTMIAANLAVDLSRRNQKVVILDLDLQFGDVNLYLGLEPKDTVVELLQEQKVINIDNIRNYLTLHYSGVQLLASPTSPEYAGNISPNLINPIISILRNYYDYIIIDTTSDFSELNLFLLEESSQILYVTGMDISLLSNSKKGFILLESLNLNDKIKLIVNREFSGDINLRDIEKIMGIPVELVIPNEYQDSVRALNQGVPLVMDFKNEISQSISRLTRMFSTEDVKEEEKKKSLFNLFFGSKKGSKSNKKESKAKVKPKSKRKKKKSLFGGKK